MTSHSIVPVFDGHNDVLLRLWMSTEPSPEKRFIVIPGAQHYTFLDKPHEFQQAVRTLLSLTHESSGQPVADRP